MKLHSWNEWPEAAAQAVSVNDLDEAIKDAMRILSTAVYKITKIKLNYCQPQEKDNRNVIWACKTVGNYMWLCNYAQELYGRYELEFQKEHKYRRHLLKLICCTADIPTTLGISTTKAPQQRGYNETN